MKKIIENNFISLFLHFIINIFIFFFGVLSFSGFLPYLILAIMTIFLYLFFGFTFKPTRNIFFDIFCCFGWWSGIILVWPQVRQKSQDGHYQHDQTADQQADAPAAADGCLWRAATSGWWIWQKRYHGNMIALWETWVEDGMLGPTHQ